MFPRIAGVRHIKNYQLYLTLTNGEEAAIDLADKILGRGGILKDLENIEFFKSVKVDPDCKTLVWPNQADFCPDVLYSEATGKKILI